MTKRPIILQVEDFVMLMIYITLPRNVFFRRNTFVKETEVRSKALIAKEVRIFITIIDSALTTTSKIIDSFFNTVPTVPSILK